MSLIQSAHTLGEFYYRKPYPHYSEIGIIDIKISVLREIAGALDTPVSYLVASQETDIEDEMIQMVAALKQIRSRELRKAAIAQVKVLTSVM